MVSHLGNKGVGEVDFVQAEEERVQQVDVPGKDPDSGNIDIFAAMSTIEKILFTEA